MLTNLTKIAVVCVGLLALPLRGEEIVSVGDIKIDPKMKVPATWEFALTRTEGSQVIQMGTLMEKWSESEVGGKKVLIKDGTMESEKMREHLVMDRETMAPVSISLTTRNRQNDLEFTDKRVQGTAIFRGDKTNVSQELHGKQFAGNAFYLVLRSLPLAENMSKTVRFFRAFDLKDVEVTFTVLGSDEIVRGEEKIPVWFVQTKEKDDIAMAMYWIRKDDHSIAKIVAFNEGGNQVTMVPKT